MTHFDMLINQLSQWWASLPPPAFRPDMAICAGAVTAAVVLLGTLLRLRLRRSRARLASAPEVRVSQAELRVREALSAAPKAEPEVGSRCADAAGEGDSLSLAELRQQMHRQSASLIRQDERMQALEQRLASLRQDSVSQPYALAIALAGDGLPAETLARRCGITPAEADLIMLLHGNTLAAH